MACDYTLDALLIDDVPDFSRVTLLEGRFQHKCCECGQPIPGGQIQERDACKFGGDFLEFRTCTECLHLRQMLRDAGCYVGNVHGYLLAHSIEDHYEVWQKWLDWKRDRKAFLAHPTLALTL